MLSKGIYQQVKRCFFFEKNVFQAQIFRKYIEYTDNIMKRNIFRVCFLADVKIYTSNDKT